MGSQQLQCYLQTEEDSSVSGTDLGLGRSTGEKGEGEGCPELWVGGIVGQGEWEDDHLY